MPELTLHFGAIALATGAYMLIGMLWFGPLFGKKWIKLMGFTESSMKKMPLTPLQAMAGGAVAAFLMAFVMAHDIFVWRQFFGESVSPAFCAFQMGLWVWLGYVATSQVGMVLWEGKSWKLFFLVTAHSFVAYQAMAFILTFVQ